MKRLLALLLSVLLCFCCPAFAEEAAADEPAVEPVQADEPEPTFPDSLAQWLGKLDPSQADIRAALTSMGEEYSALLRADDGLTEVEVAGLGKLQLSDGDFALNIGDETYVLDLKPLLEAIQSAQDSSRELLEGLAEELAKDAEALNQLVQQAVETILLPSASVSYGFPGSSAHIELNQKELCERLNSFIDAQIDGEAFGRLFDKCAPYLKMAMPGFPDSPKALHASWDKVAPLLGWLIPNFSIELDAQIGYGSRFAPEFACVGRIVYPRGRTGFSVEYMPTYDGFSFAASLDEYGMRGDSFDATATLDLHGEHLTGALLVDGYEAMSCALDANMTEYGLDGSLTYRRGSELEWKTSLYIWQDVEAQTLTGSLDFTNYPYDEFYTTNIASLEVHFRDNGYSGALLVPGQSINFRVAAGNNTTHVTIKTLPDYSYDYSYSLEAWIFAQQRDGYRGRCEYKQSYGGRRVVDAMLTGTISPEEIAFSWSDLLRGTSFEGGAHYFVRDDGVDLGFEFTTDAELYYRRTMEQKLPFGMNIAFDGEVYTLTFSYTEDLAFLKGEARFTTDDDNSVNWLEGEYVIGYAGNSRDDRVTRFSYTPEKATVSSGEESYTIERTACTDRELAYEITSNQNDVKYAASLALDEELCTLSAVISADGETLAALEISALEKTAVEPLDRESAVPLNMDTLMKLMNPQPAEPPVVIEDAEAAEDAAEEAVEETAEAAE